MIKSMQYLVDRQHHLGFTVHPTFPSQLVCVRKDLDGCDYLPCDYIANLDDINTPLYGKPNNLKLGLLTKSIYRAHIYNTFAILKGSLLVGRTL